MTYTYEEVRQTYPHAYKKWTEQDDEKLKQFKDSKQAAAVYFGRTTGAIKSRTQHFLDANHRAFDPLWSVGEQNGNMATGLASRQ